MTNLTSLSSYDEEGNRIRKVQSHRNRYRHFRDVDIRKSNSISVDYNWRNELVNYVPDIDGVIFPSGSKINRNYRCYSEVGWNVDHLKIFMQPDGISICVLIMLLGRQLVFKSLFSALVMCLLLSVPFFILNTVLDNWNKHIDFELIIKQYYIGFGKGFLLLLVTDFCFAGLLFAHMRKGQEWTETVELESMKSVETLYEDIFRRSPATGVGFACFASFFVAALLEEAVKLLFILAPSKTLIRACRNFGKSISQQGTLVYLIAFSLGLATAENCFYLGNSCATVHDCLMLALERLVFSMPMHLACACITSERINQYQGNCFRVIWPSVLLHGVFNFQIMLNSGLVASDILSPIWGKVITVTVSTILVLISWNICKKAVCHHGVPNSIMPFLTAPSSVPYQR
mmetsp:Transcript_18826/g.23956  ORF Transcript_18826/g.23956 Transcript_18826/m.23956 type:complete len:401 (+) Transcript_18826:511-1713(+)